MFRRFFLTAALALGVAAPAISPAMAQSQAPMSIRGATTVDGQAIVALIGARPNLVIMDNRRAEDFAAGHIEGAFRVLDTDLTEAVMAAQVRTKDTPVLFYCNGLSCGRAAKAAEMAVGWGYTQVFYYALGMEEWRRLGLPMAAP